MVSAMAAVHELQLLNSIVNGDASPTTDSNQGISPGPRFTRIMTASPLTKRKMGSNPGCIIIAVDASDCSEKAFRWYMDDLHKKEYKVIVAHCMLIPRVFGETDSNAYAAMVADIQEEAEDVRMKYAKFMRERGLSASFVTTSTSRPDRWLVDISKEEKASLMVMGCRGVGRARRALLGSTSDYVLHNAKCPVAIHHDHTTRPRRDTDKDKAKKDTPTASPKLSKGPKNEVKKDTPTSSPSLFKRMISNKKNTTAETPLLDDKDTTGSGEVNSKTPDKETVAEP